VLKDRSEIAHDLVELARRPSESVTQAGMTEAAIEWWAKAGQRSLERSALIEAIAQFTRALDQIATLPATPALRREEIKLQVALITPLYHVKGAAAPETKAAAERAHLLIEQAAALGEPPDDPFLLFSVLYGHWISNNIAFNGPVVRELAAQFLELAKKQGSTAMLMTGHRLMGMALHLTGEIAQGQGHLDRALALYDPVEHRPLATRFGQDVRIAILSARSLTFYLLGFPEAARADADLAVKGAREIGEATTLMYALTISSAVHLHRRDYAMANALLNEAVALADERGVVFWKAWAMVNQGCVSSMCGKASHAVSMITSGMTAWRSTGATMYVPAWLSYLARAYAELDQFNDAWHRIDEALATEEKTKETWYGADIRRTAGEIALMTSQPDAAKAEAYFEQALAISRKQQAKSWELRAATSMARLWRDQGKRDEARELLAPVYGWFTEGFDTLDLKEAKALLDGLNA
jgi:predicted ATPase